MRKTAYDMRISYWSTDVCSSDLFEPADEKFAIQQRHILFEAANADLRPLPVFAIDLNPGKALQRFGDILVGEFPDILGGHRFDAQVRIEIGRASCRERVCQYVLSSVDAVS